MCPLHSAQVSAQQNAQNGLKGLCLCSAMWHGHLVRLQYSSSNS